MAFTYICSEPCKDLNQKHITMELQNTPMTVQLGQGARIQLANAIIETGNAGVTIQFGSLDFPAVVVRTAVVPVNNMNTGKPTRRPHCIETSARRALSAPRATAAQDPRRRISVFERLSQSEASATKRVVTGGRVSVWVKRNSSTGELKKSFWEQRCEVPTPPKKKGPKSLYARVYRVLRTVKEKGLTKKRFQRPLAADVRRTPPRERLSFARVERTERRNNPLGEHRGVTPELCIWGSTAERSRWKGKQV
ncbi:hypothetical protein M5K25_000709 [Dendrobium thyrsiflorum]|uniref:Uncharacterized protein n=1 Tax=Dendrobium thyrsiflorum TaxID=117978 RepID=A0ABD0VV54_DENTH